ncbi:HAMP domain-containing sensor histidine kinase [Actinoplanes sp. NPDC024001]|uniref:sensor histidine kinase n=1 Tax=Actinoplanes sp. NPDC024001 TaxID=3154598 RepID=UPI0033CD7A60
MSTPNDHTPVPKAAATPARTAISAACTAAGYIAVSLLASATAGAADTVWESLFPPAAAVAVCWAGYRWNRERREQQRRESELRALMTMASHDLKSPLATATAHLEMLRQDHAEGLGDDAGQQLSGMERALGRINRLVEDLLCYAAAEQAPMDLRPVALSDLIADVIADHAGDGSCVTVDGPSPSVVADPELLRHVLDNLIGNAIKYTPTGVRARVVVAVRAASGGALRVEVADRGIGIPEADRPKVFDAFHRSANSGAYRGTGLGLAICRRIVERHGGRIGVDENPGGGSRFWFTLPQPAPSGPAAPAMAATASAAVK